MLQKVSDLLDAIVLENDRKPVGKVTDLLVDDRDWAVKSVLVNIGGRFLKKVILVRPMDILELNDSNQFHLGMSRAQLESCPDLDEDLPVSRQKEAGFYRYFKWPYFWTGAGIFGTAVHHSSRIHSRDEPGPFADTIPSETPEEHVTHDSHLRSIKDLLGYEVTDGETITGHSEDFRLDPVNWKISNMILRSTTFREELVTMDQILSVDWVHCRFLANIHFDTTMGITEALQGAKRAV